MPGTLAGGKLHYPVLRAYADGEGLWVRGLAGLVLEREHPTRLHWPSS